MQLNKKRTGGDADESKLGTTQKQKVPNSNDLSDDLDSLIEEAEKAEREAKEAEAEREAQRQKEKQTARRGCGCGSRW